MFTLKKIEGGRINVCEPQKLTVGNTAVVSGQALVLNSTGLLDACGVAVKPTFIALANAAAGAEVAVGRVEPNQVYEVSRPTGAIVVGGKYKLNTSTSTKPAAVDVDASGTGAVEVVFIGSDKILVRFS